MLFLVYRRNKAPETDLCRAEVVDFVYFKLSVELALAFEDSSYLVARYRVDPAAEGYKLYKLHIGLSGNIFSRTVEARVVSPLV